MSRRMTTFLAACALTVPAAVAAPLSAALAAPSSTGLTARNVAVCPTPQNVDTARCHAIRHEFVDRTGKPVNPNVTPSGYGPSDLQLAYGLGTASSSDGAGQTIAIVDAYDDPNAASDLTTYRNQFGLLATTTCTLDLGTPSSPGSVTSTSTSKPCFAKVNQNGVAGSYPRANGGWAQEISLDLDMASAICPNCNILLVEASSSSFTNLGASVDTAAALGAVAISNSYGSSGDASDSSYGKYYDHQGVAVTASTGDSGYGVGYPATSDFTIAVGGTTLSKDSRVSRGWSESAWSGAGSGCSTYQNEPSWQKSIAAITEACGGNRAIADVSADADPNTGVAVYDSYSYQGLSGWLVFGGTSVSSPIIASVYALAKSAGASWTAYPAASPYDHTASLWDAVGGSNGSCSTLVLCTGESGWDGPTGLGTPNGINAFLGSGSVSTAPSAPTNLTYSVSGSTVTLNWTAVSGATSYNVYKDSALDNPTTATSYSEIVADGTYSYYVTAVDSYGQQSGPSDTVSVTVSTGTGTGTAPTTVTKLCTTSGKTSSCTFTADGSTPLTWTGATATLGDTSTANATYTSPGSYGVSVSNSYGSASTSVSCGWSGRGKTKTLACS